MDPVWPDGGGLSWGVVVMSSAAVWPAGQTRGSHERCPESLVPLLTKSQLTSGLELDGERKGMGGYWGEARRRGGSRELSALIALSGSKQGTCRAVMYRRWRDCAAERSATVLRTGQSAFPDFHTV